MSYNATTIDGDEVRIIAKHTDATGQTLVSEDGTEYQADGQGLLVPTGRNVPMSIEEKPQEEEPNPAEEETEEVSPPSEDDAPPPSEDDEA